MACLGLISALALCGCGADGPPSLSEVEEFDPYPVYYVGEEVDGLPLEEVIGGEHPDGPGSDGWVFIYGDCEIQVSEGGLDGGCAPPQIHNNSTCDRWASLVGDTSKLFDFRGAKATRAGHEGSLEIFTGRSTVRVSIEPIMSVSRRLRAVGQARPTRLPPPVPGSLEGKLPCQWKPGG